MLGVSDELTGAEPAPVLRPHPFSKREHLVWQQNAEYEPAALPAEIQWISERWVREKSDANSQMPYLTYLPEKKRVLMMFETLQPIKTALIHSDDGGKTWSERRWMKTDGKGNPEGVGLGLTNLGNGRLLAYPENVAQGQWRSEDYGETWKL